MTDSNSNVSNAVEAEEAIETEISFNEQYELLATEVIGDAIYSDQSYHGKVATLRRYAEIIVRKLLGRNQGSKLTLGDKAIGQAIRALPDGAFIMRAVETVRLLGNDATHTQVTTEITEQDYKDVTDGIFDLLASLLINYFAKYKFGSVPGIQFAFSLLPPIIRYKVLIYLYENPNGSSNVTAQSAKTNIALVDKLSMIILKAKGKEEALAWINDHRSSLESLKTLDHRDMYSVCLEKTEALSDHIIRKGHTYLTFEEAKAKYEKCLPTIVDDAENIEFFDILEFLYLGRESRHKEESGYIMPNRLDRGFFMHQTEFENKARAVLRSGWYVLGKEVSSFEEEFAHYIGSKYCVGLASGLDALWIAFRLLKIGAGDEVIVQGNTYIASVMGITINGATPIFVEPDEYFGMDPSKIEALITSNTKAVLVTHLYGMASRMDEIVAICKKHNLRLVEDCAQSHGACFNGKMTGTFGDIGCFSFYPSKNLGAFGDAGAIVTDDEHLAQDFRIFRNYGSEKRYYNKVIGANSRLDELQAGLLRVRLKHMKELTEEKQRIADLYSKEIRNPAIKLPVLAPRATSVWHQYVIRAEERDRLMDYLKTKGIGTIIHYPIPPHLAEAYTYLGHKKGFLPVTEHLANTVLSIPMYNGMTQDEQTYIINTLNSFA